METLPNDGATRDPARPADAEGATCPDGIEIQSQLDSLDPEKARKASLLARFGDKRAPPFAPGNRANPLGRPKGASVLKPFLRALARNPDEDGYGAKAVKLAEDLVAALEAGDAKKADAILRAMDRTDGSVERSLRTTGDTAPRVIIDVSGRAPRSIDQAPPTPLPPGGTSETDAGPTDDGTMRFDDAALPDDVEPS